MKILTLILFLVGCVLARDPFLSKEDAVGYIVIEGKKGTERYIVLESPSGEVKLIKTKNKPKKILKQGGNKK